MRSTPLHNARDTRADGYIWYGTQWFISNAANRIKGSLTVDQVERMLTYMKGTH
ncbi:hypothetical protein J2R95_003134 [Bradyrhizobium japonicum]|nr:hypothetical protein [Bradyrhizobium japonicum]